MLNKGGAGQGGAASRKENGRHFVGLIFFADLYFMNFHEPRGGQYIDISIYIMIQYINILLSLVISSLHFHIDIS